MTDFAILSIFLSSTRSRFLVTPTLNPASQHIKRVLVVVNGFAKPRQVELVA